MFRQKKRIVYNLGNAKSTVYDFERRFPFENYRVMDYSLYYKLEDSTLKKQLDCHLKALLAGNIDEGNANMLDEYLCSLAVEASADLALQRCEHKDILRRLQARRRSDQEDFARLIVNLRKDLHQLEEEYKAICRMIETDQSDHRNSRKRGQENVQ